MKILAKVVSDSQSPDEVRLASLQLKAPKFLDAEFEKHRMLSSNSSSDRAIPFSKMAEREYFLPQDIRLNQAGMQGTEVMSDDEVARFHSDLIKIHGYTTDILSSWNHVHKQHLNRYLLGFTWQDKIVTGTEWDNFFNLRLDEAADPAMYELARVMKESMDESEAELLHDGWHLPYVDLRDFVKEHSGGSTIDYESAKLCSVARCARVSYLNHDKSDPSIEADIKLAKMLLKAGHMSPFEHQAQPFPDGYDWLDIKGLTHIDRNMDHWSGNFKNWIQLRQTL